MAAALETLEGTLTPPRADYLTLSVYEPIGVIAAITPWNSPIASDAQKVAPALAAGNAVVLKPASWSPLVSMELARIIEASGLPKGLLDSDTILNHKEVKRLRTVHAEANAILFSTESLVGSTFHITHRPCASCAGLIIQKMPSKVICLVRDPEIEGELNESYWGNNVLEAKKMLEEAGISYIIYNLNGIKNEC